MRKLIIDISKGLTVPIRQHEAAQFIRQGIMFEDSDTALYLRMSASSAQMLEVLAAVAIAQANDGRPAAIPRPEGEGRFNILAIASFVYGSCLPGVEEQDVEAVRVFIGKEFTFEPYVSNPDRGLLRTCGRVFHLQAHGDPMDAVSCALRFHHHTAFMRKNGVYA